MLGRFWHNMGGGGVLIVLQMFGSVSRHLLVWADVGRV